MDDVRQQNAAPQHSEFVKVAKLDGHAVVRHADGSTSTLKVGMVLHAGDVVLTDPGAKALMLTEAGAAVPCGAAGADAVVIDKTVLDFFGDAQDVKLADSDKIKDLLDEVNGDPKNTPNLNDLEATAAGSEGVIVPSPVTFNSFDGFNFHNPLPPTSLGGFGNGAPSPSFNPFTQTIPINTLRFTNHPADITGTDSGDVTEAGGILNGTAGSQSISGDLTVTDIDPNQSSFLIPQGGNTLYGSFTLDAAGHWTYTLNDDNAAVQALNDLTNRDNFDPSNPALTAITDSFTVRSIDGTAKVITVTIHGQNDAAIISTYDIANDVINNGTPYIINLYADPSLYISSFTLSGGALNSLLHTFQYSTDGGINWTDGTGNSFTLTQGEYNQIANPSSDIQVRELINGIVDQSSSISVDSTSPTFIPDPQWLHYSNLYHASASDVDNAPNTFHHDTITSPYGTLEIQTDGSWTYTLKNNPSYQVTGTDSVVDRFTIQSLDGTTKELAITIYGPGVDLTHNAIFTDSINPGDVIEDGFNGLAPVGNHNVAGVVTVSDPNDQDNPPPNQLQSAISESDVTTSPAQTQGTWDARSISVSLSDPANPWRYSLDSGKTWMVGFGTQFTITDKAYHNAHAATFSLDSASINQAGHSFQFSTDGGTSWIDGVGSSFILTQAQYDAIQDPNNNIKVQELVNGVPDTSLSINITTILTAPTFDPTIVVVEGIDNSFQTPYYPEFQVSGLRTFTNGFGTYTIDSSSGHWNYTLDNNNPVVQELNLGQTLTDHFVIHSVDGTPHIINITIQGSDDKSIVATTNILGIDQVTANPQTLYNDLPGEFYSESQVAPYSDAIPLGKLFHSQDLSIWNYLVGISDVDSLPGFIPVNLGQGYIVASDSHIQKDFGSFTIKADGSWNFTINSESYDVQHLEFDHTLMEQYDAQTTDGQTVTLTVTINGSQHFIPLDTLGVVLEAGGINNAATGIPFVEGTLNPTGFAVIDFITGTETLTSDKGWGTVTLDALGHWTYTLDNSNLEVEALIDGQTATDSITIPLDALNGFYQRNGFYQKIDLVNITGSHDIPVVSGVDVGDVTEQGANATQPPGTSSSFTGQLDFIDVENSNFNHQFISASGISDNGYGHFSITSDGSWTYELDNANLVVEALNTGDPAIDDTFTFSAYDPGTSDSVTKTVTVHIHGTTDVTAPPPPPPEETPEQENDRLSGDDIIYTHDHMDTLALLGGAGSDLFVLNEENSTDAAYILASHDVINDFTLDGDDKMNDALVIPIEAHDGFPHIDGNINTEGHKINSNGSITFYDTSLDLQGKIDYLINHDINEEINAAGSTVFFEDGGSTYVYAQLGAGARDGYSLAELRGVTGAAGLDIGDSSIHQANYIHIEHS